MRWAEGQQTQMKLCGLYLSNKSLSLVSSQSRPADKQAGAEYEFYTHSMFWPELHDISNQRSSDKQTPEWRNQRDEPERDAS